MEGRVSVQPDSVAEPVQHGHEVVIRTRAGEGAGFNDEEYSEAGARIIDDSEDFEASDLLVKVKGSPVEFVGHDRLIPYLAFIESINVPYHGVYHYRGAVRGGPWQPDPSAIAQNRPRSGLGRSTALAD